MYDDDDDDDDESLIAMPAEIWPNGKRQLPTRAQLGYSDPS